MRKILTIVVASSLLLAGFTLPSQAATPKAGAVCAKAGITQVVKSGTKTTKFTCVKSGKKTVWNKGVVTIAKPATPQPIASDDPTEAPTPEPKPTVIDLLGQASPRSSFLASDSCKIKSTGSKFNSVGFPLNSIWGGPGKGKFIDSTKTVNALIIPVDFPAYRAKTDPQKDFAALASNTNSFFQSVSYQKLSFKFTIANKYFTMPSNPEAYGASAWQSDMAPYFKDGLKIAASEISLESFDVVYVIAVQTIPTSAITPGPAFFGPFSTSSGIVNVGSAAGAFFSVTAQWRWLVHETGHLLGLVDLYGWFGTYADDDDRHRYFGDWDIMSQNWKNSPIELNGWSRFQLGWLSQDHLRCLDSTSFDKAAMFQVALSPIELRDENSKIGIVRLDEQRALVFEYRKNLGFDVLKPSEEGVLVYLVDGAKDSRTGPLQIVPRKGSVAKLLLDGALHIGDSVSVEGFEVSFLKSSETVALVEVRKK